MIIPFVTKTRQAFYSVLSETKTTYNGYFDLELELLSAHFAYQTRT